MKEKFMGRKQHETETVRKNVTMTKETEQVLADLRAHLGALTEADAIRAAIRLAAKITTETREGRKIIIYNPEDGTQEQIWII